MSEKMKKPGLHILFFAAVVSFSAFGGRDNSIADFPRLAGETDDSPRFQRAVDASRGGVLTVPGEDYFFAETVYVTNLCSIVMSPSARIKAIAEMEWMIKIDAMWQYRPKTAPKGVNAELYNLTFRGGTLDANGLASCLAIDNYRHFTLEDATFLNGRVYGVAVETTGRGYEMIARNLFIKTLIPGLAGNTGLYSYGGDSHYTDIVVTDCTTGVHFAGRGANRLTRIHVWGGPIGYPAKPGELPEMLKNSVCFRIDSSGEILRDCYADTGATGFWVNGWENRMFGCSYFNNTGFQLKDVTIIRQDTGSLWVGGGLFNIQTPDTRLYVGNCGKGYIHWNKDCIIRRYTYNQDKSLPPMPASTVMPVNIDVGRQLFLDDVLLAENKAKRTWYRPVKDPRNPVLKPETELERGGKSGNNPMAAPFVGGVWYDGMAGHYKCWYNAGWANGQAYAFSKDGISWTRPTIQPDGGNLVYECAGGRDQASVVMDADALDGYPFKSFMFVCADKNRSEVRRSKDGIVWTEPSVTAGTGDATTIFYNPFLRQWCYSIRSWNKTDGRTRHLAVDCDFLRGAKYMPRRQPWLKNVVGGLSGDGEELYNLDAVAYESVMIGLCQVMKQPQNEEWAKRGEPKSTSLRFGFSRPHDIGEWTFPKMPGGGEFISETRRSGDWDMGYVRSNSGVCIVLDDEIRFYYTGFAGDTAKERTQSVTKGGMYANGAMGMASMRRDGFCSLSKGSVKTKPLIFTKGDRIWLNVDAKAGSVEAVAEGLDGEKLGSVIVKGEDSTRREAFKVPANLPFTLRFTVGGEATLYAFWSSDASGKSGGYLGGGSPLSKTLRDE